MMPEEEYDLAGFTVGVVDKEKILSNETMAAGDVIIALPSTGVHSNGFSLVRKIFDIDANPDVLHTKPEELGGKTLGEALLAPTKIYVKPCLLYTSLRIPWKEYGEVRGLNAPPRSREAPAALTRCAQ